MTSRVRVLAIDDEKPARERLRSLLSRDARVELIGCCGGGAEALAAIEDADRADRADHGDPSRHGVQVLFLDVQMPEIDGFGVISRLLDKRGPARMPVVVFVTAFDEYALRAFEAHAIDYLLKPFSDERFDATLDRAVRQVRAGQAEVLMSQMQALLGTAADARALDERSAGDRHHPALADHRHASSLDKIVLKGDDRVRLLPVEQISWIEAEGAYVKIHTRDGKAHLHRGLLGSLDASLDERRFVRIHRSAIVNIDIVHELRQDAHGDYVAVLRDNTEIRVGRRFRGRLQARLGQPL
jgi:two-component system LytT family response regulator